MGHPPKEESDPFDDDGRIRTAEQARDVARGFLSVAAAEGGTAVEAVLLVVSELVSNAVQHAGGITGFHMKAGPDTVTVAVRDPSTVPPSLLPLNATGPGGFGWRLVLELSVEVRVDVHAEGKTVTAVLPCRTGAAPRD